MPFVLRCKEGVEFTVIAPAGFEILAVMRTVAQVIEHDITITSACDGEHSGPEDPHHKGEAYDFRTHDLPDKNVFFGEVLVRLDPKIFYAFIEDPGTVNEHLHAQLRHGLTFP